MSAPQYQKLLPLEFRLRGSSLIEASAGTGKTYTIAALYVRLVLQHGGANAFGKALLPPDILVVTFTEAATRELRDRIRTRLAEAARVFRQQQQPDAFLQQLRDDYSQQEWPACAARLDVAAQWMDESAIQTIHGWCQRMLREHAFASGSLFNQEVQNNHTGLYLQVVKDYWREQCYPLDEPGIDWVVEHWQGPERLWQLLSRPVQATEVGLPGSPHVSLGELLQDNQAQCSEQLQALKSTWSAWLDELQETVLSAIRDKQVDGRKLQEKRTLGWLQQLRDWCATPGQLYTGLSDSAVSRLSPEGWREAWKNEEHIVWPAAIEAMAQLQTELARLDSQTPDQALWHAAAWVRRRFAEEKQQRAQIGFNDMLLDLQQALRSAQGEALAAIIRQQFPVALIDEFQDTDPVQYDIFNRIYRLSENSDSCGLFLIGDPKQAIYSFRGADIYTYLQARADTSGRHYNLDTNFRSSLAMVGAVNALFLQAEQQQRQGAFLFRGRTEEGGEGDNPLPFVPVQAQGRKEVWVVEGEPQPALTFWQLETDDEGISKAAYQHEMAQRCASEIVRLLNAQQTGYVQEGRMQPVSAGDMAILVRDRHEAQAVRMALLERAVRSVYLSDRDSVYDSEEALDLQFWLNACLHPQDERALKAALASRTLGLSVAELESLQQNELLWEQHVLRFRHYQQVWQQQGVLPMLRQLMHDYDLPQRLVQQVQGERALTNLLHLAEVLQQASRELDGQLALLEFIRQAHADPDSVADEQILRLESDAELVRVVTIHKSKGLEYPLVFLPFICSYRAAKVEKGQLVSVRGKRRFCLEPEEDGLLVQLEEERLAEDLRLFYVALTRARHACWLGMAQLSRQPAASSAPGYLLGEPADEGMQRLAQEAHSQLLAAPPASTETWIAPDSGFNPACRPMPELQHESWWIASYSALSTDEMHYAGKLIGADGVPQTQAEQVLGDDERNVPEMQTQEQEQTGTGIHGFPRGAAAGTFLHTLLEKLLGDEGEKLLEDKDKFKDKNKYRGEDHGELLFSWMKQLLNMRFELPESSGFTLGQLEQRHSEMEFWFASHGVSATELDTQVQKHILNGQPRPALQARQLNGLFKGFIDLVFVADGRYYIADYKSNWLGADDAAYTEQAMNDCVLKHRYDMQYALYTLALHRLLKSRLPGYSYDDHVGGVVYLFLRGIHGPKQGVHHVKLPRALIEGLDRLFQGPGGQGK